MTIEHELTQLAAAAQSARVAERRAAVQQAARLLDDRRLTQAQHDRIVAMLHTLQATDDYPTVRADAAALLAREEATIAPDDRPYMIGVRCPQGHVSYYDRRRLCSEESVIVRSLERHGDRQVEMFHVTCRTPGCSEQMKLPLDCGEYSQ